MVLALVGFTESPMRQSPMNGTNYAEIVAGAPSRGWRTFFCNHTPDIAAMDLFVVPTIGFDLLYAFGHRRARPQRPRLDQRHSNSDDRMVARQIAEAFPWNEAPRYMIRDRDRIYGSVVTRRCAPWASGIGPLH
jgi:hypothetical protein